MERQDIEAELNEVERDLADIARRAHIAASNLRSVMESGEWEKEIAYRLDRYTTEIENNEGWARLTQKAIEDLRESIHKDMPVAAGEGDAE